MKDRYEIGEAGYDESNVILILDHQTHEIILRGARMALPKIREMVDLANLGTEATQMGGVTVSVTTTTTGPINPNELWNIHLPEEKLFRGSTFNRFTYKLAP